MKIKFRPLVRTASALAATLALSASIGSVQASPTKGGTLVWQVQNSPRHFNSAIQSGIATGMPAAQIFASPLRYDENWNPKPYLAESWQLSEDGLSLTLNLVKGATFHDGKPITSADVAFSLMTVKDNHPFKTMFEPVSSVETPDPHTAVIKLDKPHPAILLAMSPALLPIIPKHVYDDGQDIKQHTANIQPVGSGPFKLMEYKSGQHILLERNEDFFIQGRPYLDKIVMRIIRDGANRTISMERGEGHFMAFEDRLRDIKRMEKSQNLSVTNQGYSGIGPLTWLAYNTQREPFNKKEVRQAISYAIDQNFITNGLMLGLGTRADGPIAPATPLASTQVEPYEVDLEKAKKLLDKAGYPVGKDGYRFSFKVDYVPGFPLYKSIAEYLKPQLKKVGIKVEPRPAPDFATWAARVSSHDFDVTTDIVYNWGDPVIGVHRTYLSSNIKPGVIWSNTQSYSNTRVDTLLKQAASETDATKRKALYEEFQQIVVDDAPVTYLTVAPFHTVYNNQLRNIPKTIWGALSPLDEVYWNKAK